VVGGIYRDEDYKVLLTLKNIAYYMIKVNLQWFIFLEIHQYVRMIDPTSGGGFSQLFDCVIVGTELAMMDG
jgi:hypothetical protein